MIERTGERKGGEERMMIRTGLRRGQSGENYD